MAFRGFVYRVTAEETCLIPVGDLHAAPMSSPFTSGFFPGETAIGAYWGITVKGPPNCSSHCHLPFWGVIGLFFPCCGAVKGSLTALLLLREMCDDVMQRGQVGMGCGAAKQPEKLGTGKAGRIKRRSPRLSTGPSDHQHLKTWVGCLWKTTALCSKAQVAGRLAKVSENVSRWPEVRVPQNQAWNFSFPCIS